METIHTLFLIWAIFACPAACLAGLVIFFGRRRVDSKGWEALVFVIPFGIWACLMASDLSVNQKSLGNLGEPIYFTAAIPVVALVRVVVGRRLPQTPFAVALIVLVSTIAIATFFLVSPLPEY